MASSSSSSNKYDVFLSFRGEDTRDNFTSHLYEALRQKPIETFIDNQLVRGDEISPSLLNAIKQSKIAVVILSEGYASSRWCLKELAKILKYGLIVIPVFYGVDPSDVRNQTGNFGDGLSKLEERFMEREKLQKWRNALREVANLSGFDSRVRPESELVKEIVKDIWKRLMFSRKNIFSIELDKDLVGIEPRIMEMEIESLLSDNSIGTHTLGIWGIGGIGKTTIARAILDNFSYRFHGSCFIQNIREGSERGGLAQLQQKLLSALLGDGNLNNGFSNFNFVMERINRKKVLVVFDDVTDFTQIKSLIENLDCFGMGSLIIITTRDKQVLRDCRVKIECEMEELKNDDALKLFSRRAFNGDQLNVGYEELSYTVMQYCHGVPLALEVLGRFLYKKSKEEWGSAIKKLKKFPDSKIQKVLEISYGGLDYEQKNIFLDIAYLLKGEGRDFAIKFLDACGFDAQIGLSVLEDKCLIKLSGDNRIIMHDFLQEMSKEIIRRESENDPGKRSRLWHPEEICDVLKDNTGTEAIQGISLNMSEVKEEINLNLDIFKKMHKLRFLKLYGDNKFKIYNIGGLGYIFPKLKFFNWEGYPSKLLPQNICTENLVFLRLHKSKAEQLWNGIQNLANLKEMVLNDSKHLTELPDLSKAQSLESLSLRGCKSLNSLPSSIGSKSLKMLDLCGCSNVKRIPEILSCDLENLDLAETGIEELPSFVEYQSRLVSLQLQRCSRLENLPRSLCKLKSLLFLDLHDCSNLRRLPDELGNLDSLKRLSSSGTLIREVPSSILCLNKLQTLELSGLRGHKQNGFISSISSSLVGLCFLRLTDCDITELPENLGQLSSLEFLDLSENNFERIPESIINLSNLGCLLLCYCQRLLSLPKLPCSLKWIYAHNCTSLESLSSLAFFIEGWVVIGYNFQNCYKLKVDEFENFFEESLQKFQMEIPKFRGSKIITFPGSEIPEWFKNQSTGSSITLELPPADHQMLIGFAFCLIVQFEGHRYSKWFFSMYYTLKVKTVDGNWHFDSRDRELFILDGYVDSDHVILGCTTDNMIFDFEGKLSDINEVSIQFNIQQHVYGCCKWLKKCGIRLLYDQNYGESMKDCSTSFKRRRIG